MDDRGPSDQCHRPIITIQYQMGLSENRVYSQWNSHLIRIMISKTIGFFGVRHFQTHPHITSCYYILSPWLLCDHYVSDEYLWISLIIRHQNGRIQSINIGHGRCKISRGFVQTPHGSLLDVYARPGRRLWDNLPRSWAITMGKPLVNVYIIERSTIFNR